jgi:hypothetical protein
MPKAKRKEEPAREKRISMEIVVDAYDAWEQALGWYYYLQDTLCFPFPAKCISSQVPGFLDLPIILLPYSLPFFKMVPLIFKRGGFQKCLSRK